MVLKIIVSISLKITFGFKKSDVIVNLTDRYEQFELLLEKKKRERGRERPDPDRLRERRLLLVPSVMYY